MAARDLAPVLRQCPAFAPLPAREIDALAGMAITESHRARDRIFDEGDPALWLYVVRSGHVKIVRHSRTGRDIVLEPLGPGEIFGAVAVLAVEMRLAAVVLRLIDREGRRAGPGIELPFPVTRQSLADMAGTTVESAIRVVSRWLRDGLLSEEHGRLTVIDPVRLRALADGQSG